MNETRVVYMGSPHFAVPPLRSLAKAYNVVGVVTQPDRRAGRGKTLTSPPVKETALELGLPVMQPKNLKEEAYEQLVAWQPEVIVVAAFGQILRSNVLSLPPFGCINVHASLLPRWRGAAPINAAILHGDEQTGITIMKMDKGIDTGPMLSQTTIPIHTDDNAETLSARLQELGAEILIDTLPRVLDGSLIPTTQPEESATYAPMLKKEDGRLDFSNTAVDLERQVRAFTPWPGTFTTWKKNTLKVNRAHVAKGAGKPIGTYLTFNEYPAVQTAEDILVLDVVQPAGKKAMDGKSFLLGTQSWEA